MWGLSAYFARVRMQRQVVTTTPQSSKYIVSESGNRRIPAEHHNRKPCGAAARQRSFGRSLRKILFPRLLSRRAAFSPGELAARPSRARLPATSSFPAAIVNYIWEKFMVQAFVSPSNTFDLARLDPYNPPADPWTLQPTNPQLLDALAQWFQANHYDLRALMSLIAKSNAYQLSAAYPGTWDVSYVPYYARRYVRRLDAEEVHDAITKATSVPELHAAGSSLPPVQWAMQFPDTKEPRSNGTVVAFLNAFGRGDRDTTLPPLGWVDPSSMNMMNSRSSVADSPDQPGIARVGNPVVPNLDAGPFFGSFLEYAVTAAVGSGNRIFHSDVSAAGNQVAAENLQWVLLNKVDFLFNY